MEQKTVEQYLREKGIHPTEPIYWDLANKTISLNELLDDYAKQQQEIAVEKALEVVEDKFKTLKEKSINLKDMLYLDGVMAVISTSKPEILKELEK